MLLSIGCKSDTKGAGESGGDEERGLMMSSDSAVCKKAMSCCVALVKSEKGKASPEDVNLKCSGVALADTDDMCTQFHKGYVMALESSDKAVPAECK